MLEARPSVAFDKRGAAGRSDHVKQKVRANSVCPGFIDTAMIAPVIGVFDDPVSAGAMVPMGRAGRAEEIANALLFFASDESSYCTGSNLLVDGGCTSRSFARLSARRERGPHAGGPLSMPHLVLGATSYRRRG
ncbi:MAG: SDR family oxidoreductase [Solirubrobacterales bacterium]|nr:SDR family oxidoreductase [Solirubrobacterales bacterium]